MINNHPKGMKHPCAHPKPCNKRNFYFKAFIQLGELSLRLPKGGDLSFEVTYLKNTISSKGFHQLSSVLPNRVINETLEIPFQAVYDKRKQQFFAEPLHLHIINMHLAFRKKLGVVVLLLSHMLNTQQVSQSAEYKVDKSIDKQATLKINIRLKYLGNTDVAKNLLDLEESYFPDQSIG
jgi:hypothetical protein